jgi:ribonuclease D
MDYHPEEDEKFKSLSYPVISDEESANQILTNILQNSHAIIGMDTEAAVEMSRFGILCLLQVTNFKII